MIESRRDLFKLAILVCKIGIVLTFASIFLFWSATAILKFASEPINSNIRFHYGDDNNGKVCISLFQLNYTSFQFSKRNALEGRFSDSL